MNFAAFLNLFHNIIYSDDYDDEEVSAEVNALLDEFDQLEEVQYLRAEKLGSEELAIYLFVVARQSIFGDYKVTLERIFRVAVNDNFSKYYFQTELLEKRSQLITNDLIKFTGDSYMDSV